MGAIIFLLLYYFCYIIVLACQGACTSKEYIFVPSDEHEFHIAYRKTKVCGKSLPTLVHKRPFIRPGLYSLVLAQGSGCHFKGRVYLW